jgi:diadenylate cyclase
MLHYLTLALDIGLVYILIYQILLWTWNSHAFKLIKGLFIVLCVYLISHLLGLTMLNWILGKFATVLILIVFIIFQPELRRLLEWIGSIRSVFSPTLSASEAQGTLLIRHMLRALEILTREKIGALIVIEIHSNLSQYSQSGVAVNSTITAEVLSSLFWPGSPTHDGAVIIRENKIESAGCLLPLTDTKIQDRRLGTRHRAALGLSELTDALIFVVSEETGIISMAENGKLIRYLNKEAIETRLFNLYKEGN